MGIALSLTLPLVMMPVSFVLSTAVVVPFTFRSLLGFTFTFISWFMFANVVVMPVGVQAHMRLVCPPPRSPETGAKTGPCDAPNNPAQDAFPLAPGWQTVVFEESIFHAGAPQRIALPRDGADDGFETCVLLDHIPHFDRPPVAPRMSRPTTYTPYRVSVYIPDVKCERCTLQLISVMSDWMHGVPIGTKCAYKGALDAGTVPRSPSTPACPVVYHSCAPVSINGTGDRNAACLAASSAANNASWPYVSMTPNVYDHAADTADFTSEYAIASAGPWSTASGQCANAWGTFVPKPSGMKTMDEFTALADDNSGRRELSTTSTTRAAQNGVANDDSGRLELSTTSTTHVAQNLETRGAGEESYAARIRPDGLMVWLLLLLMLAAW